MRVGQIEHIRCDEPVGSTYVVIPDEMSTDEFKAAVYRAKKKYTDALDLPYPGEPQFRRYMSIHDKHLDPGSTVAEIRAQYLEEQAAWKEWFNEREKARQSFGAYLKEEGLTPVQMMTHDDHVPISWGHRHSQKLRLDEYEFSLKHDDDGI